MDNHIGSLASHTTYIKKPISLTPTAQENHTTTANKSAIPIITLDPCAPLTKPTTQYYMENIH